MTKLFSRKKEVEMEVSELVDASAQRISLVGRGAMRIPFRILKNEEGDEPMHISDLRFLFGGGTTVKKTEDVPSKLIAVAIKKGENLEGYALAVAEKGFTVLKQDTSRDDVDLLILDETANLETALVVKMDDSLALMVEGATIRETVAKSFSSWNTGKNFDENMKIQGFYPGVRMASDCLIDTIYNIMWSDDTKAAPADEIGKALKGFSAYVLGLVNAIPTTAFKLEGVVAAPKVSEESTEGTTDETVTKGDPCPTCGATMGFDGMCPTCAAPDGMVDKNCSKQTTMKSDPPTLDGVAQTTTPPVDASLVASGTDPVSTTTGTIGNESTATGTDSVLDPETSEDDDFTKKVAGITSQFQSFLDGLKATVDGMVTKLDNVTTEVSTLKETVAKTDEALGSVVIGGAVDDKSPTATVKKTEKAKGVFDDAFSFPGLDD